jgi:signal transduction histidine kinase
VGAREGGQAADQDPVPARRTDLPADLHRGPRARRLTDRPGLQLVRGERRGADRLTAFAPAITAIRWATAAVGVALSAPEIAGGSVSRLFWCSCVVAYTLYRSFRPIRYVDDFTSVVVVVAELALGVAAVDATGYWDSPFVFSLVTAVSVAGFARGFAFGLQISAMSIAAVWLPDLVRVDHDHLNDIQPVVVVLLVALVTGYARRISGEADRQHTLALDRLGRLADANALLFSLHRVAQSLPASLDLDEALDSTMTRLRDLFDYEVAVVLLHDDTDDTWSVARAVGTRLTPKLTTDELPPPMRRALGLSSLVEVPNLLIADGPGIAPQMYSGLYTVLPARGSVIGLVAIEHPKAGQFNRRDVDLLNGFVEPAALAIDNAQWFGRLRTVGAEEERTRIARDLHDRIGQSLAYLAFELDRIIKSDERGESVSIALTRLRSDVRAVVSEVRDTLYDLRTDVSDSQDLLTVLQAFLARVEERSAMRVTLRAEQVARLPLLQEREMFRIAQEAVVNVERHADAGTVTVTWSCDGKKAFLEVADDGAGFPVGHAGRLDSYGITGMRERASSIGATFDIDSEPGHGTKVRCTVGGRPRTSSFWPRRASTP